MTLFKNAPRPEELDDLKHGRNRARIIKAIHQAVVRTLDEDKKIRDGGYPEAEFKYRAKKAWSIAQVLRYEMHWSMARICDHLHTYLRAELDGAGFEPAKKARWAASES